MCDKKPCDNCCHEEDLLCCMPLRHCCGGYSEHNNCCPHDRCCNHPCGGCDCCDGCGGCQFGPEPCCCKAMKCCKKCKEELEKLSEKTADDIGKLNSDVEENSERITEVDDRLTEQLGNLAEKEQNDVDDLQSQINAEVERATGREDQIEDNSIADVIYDANRKELKFVNKEGDVLRIIDASDFVRDGMLSSVTLIDLPNGNKGLLFVFNTDSGKETITVDVGDIFETSDYYNKNTIDGMLNDLEGDVTHTLSWSGYVGGSYDGTANASFTIPNNTNQLTNGANFQNATQVTNAVTSAINGLDSSRQALSGYAISGITLTNGVLASHSEIKVPSSVSELTNDSNFSTQTWVNTQITNAIGNLDSSYEPGTGKAIHSISLTDGVLGGTAIDIPTKTSDLTNDSNFATTTDITNAIGGLDSSITAETNKAIASVVVTDGKITSHTKVNLPTVPTNNEIKALFNSNYEPGAHKATHNVTLTNGVLGGTAIDVVEQVNIGSTQYIPSNGVIALPAYPTGSTTNVTIDGTSVNLETLLNQIVDRIDALEALWTRVTDNNVTYLQPVTSTDKVRATAFYDTSVS